MHKLLHLFYTGCLLLIAGPALAGDPFYPAAAIPAELKEKTHAVKRSELLQFKLGRDGEASLVHHYVITVLDPVGDDEASLEEGYDKLREIRSISGTLYDEMGRAVKKLKQSDIEDVSALSASLITDDRIKRHTFNYNVYPYTVEYKIETRFKCTFIFPTWTPQTGKGMAVEESQLEVSVPTGYQLRYRAYNYSDSPVIVEKGISYSWKVKNMKVQPDEALAPAWWRRTTLVRLSPSDFEMEGYKGNLNTWEDFGKFMYQLNQGRDQLPETVKQQVHQLTDGVSDQAEKIKLLYRYLQQHTRYISIQLGIGGWQTFDAAYVAGKGYGDCKALSNYMYALLKEAGIPSHYTLVHAGEGATDFDESFPSNQFNHVILCVPAGKDTTWLECTSAYLQPGYLSAFTANRPVLLVTANGGKLVRTPAYTPQHNLQLRRLNATLTAEGHLQAQVSTLRSGEQQDDLFGRLHAASREKIMEWIRTSLPLPSYDVTQYDCQEQAAVIPAISEQLSITARNYASSSGKRMFLEPNVLNKSQWRFNTETQRRSDIHLPSAWRDTDTVNITIPAGYVPESIPKGTELNTRFGAYTSHISVSGNTITYIRTMQQNAGDYPPADFAAIEGFFEAVYKADRCRIVLVKQ